MSQQAADELQEAIDASMPTTYTVITNNFNLEDLLHRLFTQLYNDDLLFDLVIESHTRSETDITFTTLYPEVKVKQVLSGYNIG